MKKGHVNMCVEVPKEFRDLLKILAIKEGTDLKSLVKAVLDQYVESKK